MNIGIIGIGTMQSEDRYNKISGFLKELNLEHIITGTFIGIESMIARYATESNIKLTLSTPNNQKHKRKAFIYSKFAIINQSDMIIIIYENEKDKFTESIISQAQKSNKPFKLFKL